MSVIRTYMGGNCMKCFCLALVDVFRVITSEIPTPVRVDMTAGFNTTLIRKAHNDGGRYMRDFQREFYKGVRCK